MNSPWRWKRASFELTTPSFEGHTESWSLIVRGRAKHELDGVWRRHEAFTNVCVESIRVFQNHGKLARADRPPTGRETPREKQSVKGPTPKGESLETDSTGRPTFYSNIFQAQLPELQTRDTSCAALENGEFSKNAREFYFRL